VRLPFPDHIPFVVLFYFAIILCGVQLLEGTDGIFSLCCFFFIIVSGLSFNLAGGFTRPSGSYVFFFATLTLIVGLCWKAFLGEPANSNLEDPVLTITLYLGSICAMFVSVLLSRHLTTKRALLQNLVADAKLQHATVGCLIVGVLIWVATTYFTWGSGSVISAVNQINQFLPLAIVLGTFHTIRRSGGTRSVNLPVLLAGIILFGTGILGFSKQGILTPFVCWLMTAACQRYKVSLPRIGLGLVAAFLIVHYLVPYAQYGRAYRGVTPAENFEAATSMLTNLGEVREQYLETSTDAQQDALYNYFDSPQGLIDRLQMVSMDDALITYKRQTSFVGIGPIIEDIENLVPRLFWKNKPVLNFGNDSAHEIGLLSDEDSTTGVSFSPVAEAYALLGWTSVLLVAPLVWLVLFTVFDSLCGDVRRSPWGLLVAVIFAHSAPEGGLGGPIYMIGYTTFAIVVAAATTAYLMPVLGTLFIGPEGIGLRRGKAIGSIPNRLIPSASSKS
jgi:hypothetical protein